MLGVAQPFPQSMLFISCIDLSWMWSPKDYWYATISALIGVIIGIGWAKRQWRREREADRQALKQNIVKAFRLSLGGIDQCIKFLTSAPPIIPNYRLDSLTVSHLLLSGRGLFHNQELFDQFNWQRYQLDHINAKLDYLHIYLALTASTGSVDTRMAQSEYNSLVSHLHITKKEISALLEAHEGKPW